MDSYKELIKKIDIEKQKINALVENIMQDTARDIVKAREMDVDESHILRIRNHIRKLSAVKKIVIDKPLNIDQENLEGLTDFWLELRNAIVVKEFHQEIISMRKNMMGSEDIVNIEDEEVRRLYNKFMNIYNRFYMSIYISDKREIVRLHDSVIRCINNEDMDSKLKAQKMIENIKSLYKLQEDLKKQERFQKEKLKSIL